MRNIWWSGKESSSHIKRVGWSKLCTPKAISGLGFIDLQAFNLALLSKLAWRMHSSDGSLLFHFLKSKYFPSCSFLNFYCRKSASWVWKGICAAKALVSRSWKWRVVDGSKIDCWTDSWLPDPNSFFVTSPKPGSSSISTVADLINHDLKQWKYDLVVRIFNERDAALIL
ncbi:uncharacterized mitochondrial protein AtMg00310-like [Cornus florida]|uniref:uncharacterized mitochondrial protein AtMg00310-like n=1 Tax=Cornus florida TaxID=4283 RepID=UPI0028A1AE6E|nr:uncharacterized mitochondrial protein AtMg00310-like [Cornus florida]